MPRKKQLQTAPDINTALLKILNIYMTSPIAKEIMKTPPRKKIARPKR